ncbi:GIY-YIG nuclease family protein [Bifidobacterium magnum]|uniref:Bacteriophage T5 Orf172 DNA-binding domain-containing protein n=1 Tax=Bifidobacterium magnum TaxID=1692 RepID=A0A087B989_9BIFI|nr:GIY-YIG nuclease family protein [Bifidobacterium magnum]KFI67589.1 putative Type IIG restriction enzyme/N6-adenine DNA methyltransferase of unknown recognition sequence [Bifidobacterium magnum]
MSDKVTFPQRPDLAPRVYAYEEHNPNYDGYLKVGYTTRTAEERVAEQFPIIKPDEKPYTIVFDEPAMRDDGTTFTDDELHKWLKNNGYKHIAGEWFKCNVDDVRAAWMSVKDRTEYDKNRIYDFPMRPEQARAVSQTKAYFDSINEEDTHRKPKFLWNAKMRFGKTFAAYELAKELDAKRVLILTFKPAVQNAWHDDLMLHVDFEGWQFVTRDEMHFEDCDEDKPIVCFGSFQDFLGVDNETGGIKPRNEWVHLTEWDLVIFDEYHFGAWGEKAKGLFAKEDDEKLYSDGEYESSGNELDESWLPIEAKRYLYLSGTPFRALNSGEFIEEQVFNWTYGDEQEAKANWSKEHPNEPNPYAALPKMALLTYQMPEEITRVAMKEEFNEFDLNVFFSAKGEGDDAEFVYKNEVQKWLDLMRNSYDVETGLKQGGEKPPMPYSDTRLLGVLNHSVWFLPRVNSCYAMRNLLAEKQNVFYHEYTVNVCAGAGAGQGADALPAVEESMEEPLKSKTITLSCGKLMTGVTVRPWTGILMLRNLNSPETYFQAAFRVQSPWEVDTEEGREIMKQECYVFDFALTRALRQVSDYSCRLSVGNKSPEEKVAEFIKFLPVLAYDGYRMQEVDAADILDLTMAGTSATLLARRWESAMLVNVDNETLARLLANPEALEALMSIEGFRSLNQDIETIINKSEHVKKVKKEKQSLTKKEKKELSEEEKEYKSKRKEIQEKLIKFATRIPIFMYLTDYREQTLKDVITQLEPNLFKRVTGLDVKDFELLVSLGVFDDKRMNESIYYFRRYEDASLVYSGLDKHAGERVGLFDTTISEYEYLEMAQRDSMVSPQGYSYDSKEAAEISEKWTQDISEHVNSYQTVEEEEPEVVEPEFDEEAIENIDVGDVVFHKGFGYGSVVRMDGKYIIVKFDSDKKKERSFRYPNAFYDGFLSIEG